MGTPCGVRPTTGREGKLKQKGQYQFFVTATILKRWLKLLLDNVIISFGQDIKLRQEIGLPMGINPAVFIANYYGLDYEVDFFQQLIRQNRYDPPYMTKRNTLLSTKSRVSNTHIPHRSYTLPPCTPKLATLLYETCFRPTNSQNYHQTPEQRIRDRQTTQNNFTVPTHREI